MKPDVGIYKRVAAVLKTDAAITAFPVHADNIRPSDDLEQAKTGALIHFTWTDYSFDTKARRATGVLAVAVESEVSKPKAQDLAALVRLALTAKALTGNRADAIVGLFKERAGTTDAGESPSGRFQVLLSYDVRAVET